MLANYLRIAQSIGTSAAQEGWFGMLSMVTKLNIFGI